MSESPTASFEKLETGTVARVGWGLLIVATLCVCYFSHLGAIGFVGPDEPRYAWIARAMAETGDWVTPRLYGQPWFEKPPLYYWEAAVSFKVFGVSEAAARLPSAISALLATLALAWLAWRMYGEETARWLLLLLPTTVGMIGFSHAAATDMPFSGMLTIAMVCAAIVLRLVPSAGGGASPAPTSPSMPWTALILFGFFLGLAVLAKGPAGIILCGGAVFFWAIFTKRWRDAFRLLHPAAVAAFCLTALPWYILCARRNPDFCRIFIIEHNFKRYLTPEFQHIQPFWFYVPVLLAALFPWTVLFGWAAFAASFEQWRRRRLGHFNWLLF
ncbi:MAG: glycosyltransferase family 39 protein, partial [Candidatus Acidiferrum sp.]